MLTSGHGSLARWLAAFLCIGILSWLALEYLVPSPPSRITIATGPKGSTFDYFGRRYRARFARVGIDLQLRQTVGALENFQLLQDPKSGVEIGFVTGGISDGSQAPGLLSTGLIYNVPFWIFYPSSTTLDGLPQLKGKRIAVGPEGSGTRFTAERILSKANINARTATLVPLEGNAAIEALNDGRVDAVLIVGGSDAPAVRTLLTNPQVRLMDFPTAEAFTRLFPDLVRLVLPKGAIEIDPPNPPNDVTLVGTTAKVLIRDDLHPAVVQLLARTMKEEHSGLGLFQRSGEFPSSFDPEYPMAQVAVDYYKNGPSFLAKYLPFWMTIYAQRLIAFSVAAIAIVFPAFSFAPRLYEWIVQTRLRSLYRRLRVVENALHVGLTASQIADLQSELADIDKATSTVPMRHSDLYFMLRYHLSQMRSRLAEASEAAKVGQKVGHNGS
jgi:TRAP-type uncharacterized transport system substrate-binding protein